jgi:phosphoglycolate phosphatase
MHTIDLLIFDLDGTLIDSKEDIATAVNLTLRDIGLPPKPSSVIAQYIGCGVRWLLEQTVNASTPSRASGPPPIEADDLIPVFRRHYLDHLLDRTTLFPGAIETLDYFSGKRLAIATNKPMEYTTPILDGLGISHYFSIVLGGNSTANRKPHPDMLVQTMETLDVGKEHSLMIGDGINDVLAAKAAGIQCCVVTYGMTESHLLLQEGPDYVCHSLPELQKICPTDEDAPLIPPLSTSVR